MAFINFTFYGLAFFIFNSVLILYVLLNTSLAGKKYNFKRITKGIKATNTNIFFVLFITI